MRTSKTAGRLTWLVAVIVSVAACSQEPSPEMLARIDTLQMQRDSLSRALAEQEAYVQSLSQQIEEAMGEVGGATASGEDLGQQINVLRSDLQTARSQLEEAQQRIGTLNWRASAWRDSVAAVTERAESTAATHRDSIQALVASTESMDTRIQELTSRRETLEETLSSLEEETYTAYYAVGTKDELLNRGVVEEVGGARILLLLWRAGETLVPARALDVDQFESVDLRRTTSIPLPAAGTYRVVSRHDTRYLEPTPDGSGRFTGESLQITDPDAFWEYSPFLILVRED